MSSIEPDIIVAATLGTCKQIKKKKVYDLRDFLKLFSDSSGINWF